MLSQLSLRMCCQSARCRLSVLFPFRPRGGVGIRRNDVGSWTRFSSKSWKAQSQCVAGEWHPPIGGPTGNEGPAASVGRLELLLLSGAVSWRVDLHQIM